MQTFMGRVNKKMFQYVHFVLLIRKLDFHVLFTPVRSIFASDYYESIIFLKSTLDVVKLHYLYVYSEYH